MTTIVNVMKTLPAREFICSIFSVCLKECSILLSLCTPPHLLSLIDNYFIFLFFLLFPREFFFFFVADKSSSNAKKSKYDADDDDDEEDDKKKDKKNWFSRKRAGSLADSEADTHSKFQS